MKHLISIITATFNSSKYILETYKSICSQTYTNWEWIITDDASTDDTVSILRAIADHDSRVNFYCLENNKGAAQARNNSIKFIRGDFVCFIDSDDLWHHDKLTIQLAHMLKGIDFSFTAYQVMDEFGVLSNKLVDFNNNDKFNYSDMLKKKATLGCSTVMLKRNAFNDISMPLLRTGQDYALWLKLLRTGSSAYLVNDVLCFYRIVPGSISRNKFKKAIRQWEIYYVVEDLGFLISCYCFLHYAWRAIFRR